KFAKALREARLADGRKLEVRWAYGRREDIDPDELSANGGQAIDGKITTPLPPGEYAITFVVDAGVLPGDAVFETDYNHPGQKVRWQKPIHSWVSEVPMKLTVAPAEQTIVELQHLDALDPVAAGALRPPRILVRKRSGQMTVEVHWPEPEQTPVNIV